MHNLSYFQRSAGIILHPTSLPSPYGIGELGRSAFKWVDFLAQSGQHLWQVMPLGHTGYGDSPYQCFSAFAGNPYLISLESLLKEGLLAEKHLADFPKFPDRKVNYGQVISAKIRVLDQSYELFKARATEKQTQNFAKFCKSASYWLNDYALFMAYKEANQSKAWQDWQTEIRSRVPKALNAWQEKLANNIMKYKYWQWLFFTQWITVKNYANKKGINIIGDVPIFVAADSADAWANPELFYLDNEGNPTVVAGVPPDYFSKIGQRWGNPLYNWKVMRQHEFSWWIKRLKQAFKLFDIVRIDHFRGLEAYWEIPAKEPTAIKGNWVKGPGQDFFDAVKKELIEPLPIIAEDLGVITPAVEKLRDDNQLLGMKILQFAFSVPSNPYLPHNYLPNSVVYTGTHDNDTTVSWFAKVSKQEKDFVCRYLGKDGKSISWDLIRLAYSSPAVFAITTLQDILGLDSTARMNTPSEASGNWSWRFKFTDIPKDIVGRLKDITEVYGRCNVVKQS